MTMIKESSYIRISLIPQRMWLTIIFNILKHTDMNACEAMLKPKNKKQQKELDGYIKHLELRTKAEIFILNCVLYMDWSRQKIVQSIDRIRERTDGTVTFKIVMKAPYLTTDYVTSTPYGDGTGWSGEYANSLEKRMFYIYQQMDYYTS